MDFNTLIRNLNIPNLIVATATVIGAWGGFPESPQLFKDLTKHKLVQYMLVFVLLYQGGGGQDIVLSLLITLVFFIINEYIDKAYKYIKEKLD